MAGFDNVIVDSTDGDTIGPEKTKEYLAAKRDFPINVPKEYQIIGAHPSRDLFKNKKLFCMSWDGITGKRPAEGWKEEYVCKECEYLKGVGDGEEKIKCKYHLTLEIAHEDPEKMYELRVAYGAQVNLSEYMKELQKNGLEPDQVLTAITRIENTETAGTTYTFEMVKVLDLELTPEEETTVAELVHKFDEVGETPEMEDIANIIECYESLDGISPQRALAIAQANF